MDPYSKYIDRAQDLIAAARESTVDDLDDLYDIYDLDHDMSEMFSRLASILQWGERPNINDGFSISQKRRSGSRKGMECARRVQHGGARVAERSSQALD